MNNDLISREEAMDVIKSLQITLGGENIFRPEAKASVLECLDFVPKVDAEPVRHGRWEVNMVTDQKAYPAYTYKSGYKWSLCGRRERTNKEPYCHCGAKMDKEEEHL